MMVVDKDTPRGQWQVGRVVKAIDSRDGLVRKVLVNPRLTGGGRLTPPLPNIRDSSKTNSAIDVKLGRPSHTTI